VALPEIRFSSRHRWLMWCCSAWAVISKPLTAGLLALAVFFLFAPLASRLWGRLRHGTG